MNCTKIRQHLHSLVAGEAPQSLCVLLNQHIQACPDCAKELQLAEEAYRLLSEAQPVEPVPQFGAAWRSRLRSEAAQRPWSAPAARRWRFPAFRPLLPVCGVAAIVIIGLALNSLRIQQPVAKLATKESAPAGKVQVLRRSVAAAPDQAIYRVEIIDFGPRNKRVQKIARDFRANYGDGTYYAMRNETVSLTTFSGLSYEAALELRAALEEAGATVRVETESRQ
jgi:hypothetical protein